MVVSAATKGAEGLEIVDCLEEVRLPLSVFANDGDTLGGEFQMLLGQIPEVPDLEPTQIHGEKPGRIPFSMKKCSVFGPFWLDREGCEKP